MGRIWSKASKVLKIALWRILGIWPRRRPVVLHRRAVSSGSGLDEVVWQTHSSTLIEPDWGYPILAPHALSTEGVDSLRGRAPGWTYAVPAPWTWGSPRLTGPRSAIELPRVVSLRHLYEWNYYHFFFDVLGKLALLEELELTGDLPLVVGPSAAELSFATELMSMGGFAELRWVVQPRGVAIRAQEVIWCRHRLSHGQRARFVVDRLRLPPLDDDPRRRIFLVRRPPATRQIANLAEIEALLLDLGFETVDTTGWSLGDQIELFRGARFVVGIHGAGMTNLMFRCGHPMSVVELCSTAWSTNAFAETCADLGFTYDRLTCPPSGPGDPQHADLVVDPQALRTTVEAQLSGDERRLPR